MSLACWWQASHADSTVSSVSVHHHCPDVPWFVVVFALLLEDKTTLYMHIKQSPFPQLFPVLWTVHQQSLCFCLERVIWRKSTSSVSFSVSVPMAATHPGSLTVLWSVSTWNSMPIRRSESLSHAQVIANLGFFYLSIPLFCGGECSWGEGNGFCCAPLLFLEQHYSQSIGGCISWDCCLCFGVIKCWLNSCFILSKAVCCEAPQHHMFFLLSNSLSGCAFSARRGGIFPNGWPFPWTVSPHSHKLALPCCS